MHPTISQLPSKVFYDGRLRDGPEMDVKTRQPWHNDPKFGVYKFYSVVQGREESTRVGHSLVNREEIKAVLALYDRIKNQYHDVDFDYRIGIVSMYRAQVQEFRIAFRSKYGRDINGKIDFNTVDGFQGQEKDIIILSCVRAGTTLNSIGFLAGNILSLDELIRQLMVCYKYRYSPYECRYHSIEVISLYRRPRSYFRAK